MILCTHAICIDVGVCPQADQRNAKREAESSGGEKNEGEYVVREPFSVTYMYRTVQVYSLSLPGLISFHWSLECTKLFDVDILRHSPSLPVSYGGNIDNGYLYTEREGDSSAIDST